MKKMYLVSCEDTKNNRFFDTLHRAQRHLRYLESKGEACIIFDKKGKIVEYGNRFATLFR